MKYLALKQEQLYYYYYYYYCCYYSSFFILSWQIYSAVWKDTIKVASRLIRVNNPSQKRTKNKIIYTTEKQKSLSQGAPL